jgi:hypothetical protein
MAGLIIRVSERGVAVSLERYPTSLNKYEENAPPLLKHDMFFILYIFFAGNLVTIIHRVPYSAVNFTTYEFANKMLTGKMDSDVGRRMVAGGASGLVACTAVR